MKPWPPATRLLFRFAVVYLTLYAFATQIAGGVLLLPVAQLPALGHVPPMRDVTMWLAEHVAGGRPPFVYTGNSGDTLFHWVQTAWLLGLSTALTSLWLALDRRRDDRKLLPWFHLFLRFGLAGQMFYYGMAKVIPVQFQQPSLVTLVQPVGHLSLSDLLWTFIGASTPYQMLTGWAELLAGVLLVVPATATLGALVCLFDMLQVFALNMAYDFGLKQISFHLVVMSLVLLAPDLPRLTRAAMNTTAGASPIRSLFATARANRLAAVAQATAGLYLLAIFTSLSLQAWRTEGDGRPRSVLYGIWDVVELTIDGVATSPADADYDRRWRRIIFDAPDDIAFQRTDDSVAHFGVRIDGATRSLALSKGRSRTWRSVFAFERDAQNRLTLTGDMDGHRIRVGLRRVELDTFRLLGSRFRWVRPPDPYAG